MQPCPASALISRRDFLSRSAMAASARAVGGRLCAEPPLSPWTMRLSTSSIHFMSLPIEQACQPRFVESLHGLRPASAAGDRAGPIPPAADRSVGGRRDRHLRPSAFVLLRLASPARHRATAGHRPDRLIALVGSAGQGELPLVCEPVHARRARTGRNDRRATQLAPVPVGTRPASRFRPVHLPSAARGTSLDRPMPVPATPNERQLEAAPISTRASKASAPITAIMAPTNGQDRGYA